MIDFEDAPSGPGPGKFQKPFAEPPGRAPVEVTGREKYLQGLNDRQREAVLATDGPLIVLAGAGSGKTKMMVARICHLIEGRGIAPHRVLAVTFTNKAAGEMRERVERMLEGSGRLGNPEVGTFHSVCVRLLRREINRTPFTQPFVIYDDSDQLSLIKTVMDKLNIDEKAFSPKGIQGAINRAKCDAVEPATMEVAQHDIFGRQVKRVFEQYQKDLFANNALDFGEIICMTWRLLRDHEDIRRKYQERFLYIHVDEYQDTNRAQYLLLSALADSRYGGHQNICVVGDEDQSIYGWRGADIRNILDFEKDYPGARVVKLEQNYRSTKTIISAASQVIRNNSQRKDKTLWTDNEDGLPILHAFLPDERAEAEFTIAEIKRQAEHEARAYGDFSVFYRTNAQSRQFEDVLRREKIPYQMVGGLRFYDRKEIKDVLSYFKVILNPSDSVGLKRVINVPARGIGKTTIEKISDLLVTMEREAGPASVQPNFWDALCRAAKDSSITNTGTARKLAQFTGLLERLRAEQPRLLLSELYHLILDETGYVRELRKEGTDEAMARIENLEEFDTILQEFEETNYDNVPEEERPARKPLLLAHFIEQSSLVSDTDNLNPQSSAVKLMTLHSSKGLEFPVVFMAGVEEGLFPSIREWEETSEEEIEEERRLCYVGMTRARQQLYITNVAVRRFWGDVSYQEPSRFLAEIPAKFMESKNLAQQNRVERSSDFGSGFHRPSAGGFSSPARSAPSAGPISFGGATPVRPPHAQPKPAGRAGDEEVVGKLMDHPEYGDGRVVLCEGAGDERKVTVEFAGRQRRKFLFRYVEGYLE